MNDWEALFEELLACVENDTVREWARANPDLVWNTPTGPYLLRCKVCDETFELNERNCLGQPMWIFTALCTGFGLEHRDCIDPHEEIMGTCKCGADYPEGPCGCEGEDCGLCGDCCPAQRIQKQPFGYVCPGCGHRMPENVPCQICAGRL